MIKKSLIIKNFVQTTRARNSTYNQARTQGAKGGRAAPMLNPRSPFAKGGEGKETRGGREWCPSSNV
jgi:hypothetical protein